MCQFPCWMVVNYNSFAPSSHINKYTRFEIDPGHEILTYEQVFIHGFDIM